MREVRMSMAFLQLLLSNTLFFIVVASLCADVSCFLNRDTLLTSLNNVIPKHYDVKLMPDIQHGVFIGECNGIFILEDKKQSIGFHSENLTITEVKLIERNLQVSEENIVTIRKPIQRVDDYLEGIVVLYFAQALSPGKYILTTKFSGTLTDKDGFFRTSCTDSAEKKTWMAATYTQTGKAPKVFPCWNNPQFKTTFNISVRHHKAYVALSNMPRRASEEDGNDMRWTHFRTTPAISAYSVAAVVIPQFVSKRNSSNDKVVMWSRIRSALQMDFASDIAGRVARYLEDEQRLNSLKVPEVNHVAIQGLLPFKTIATLGLVLYREEDIIYCDRFSVAQKYNVARLVAHQVARQWIVLFADPLKWSSDWSYGAAEFFGVYALEKTIPDSKILNLFVIQTQHESLHLDVDLMEPIESSTHNATLVPSRIKVSSVLRMLQNVFTEDLFWKSMQKSLNQSTFSPRYFMESSDVRELKLNNPITNLVIRITGILSVYDYLIFIIPSWIFNKNYPLMRSHVSPEGPHEKRYRLLQSSFIRGSDKPNHFIPFTYTEENHIDFEKSWPERSESAWLQPNISFPFTVSKRSNWFICNVRQIGYYRVTYSKENWDNIVSYLRITNHRKIHVLNRAQIIDDLYHLMKEKQFEFKMTFQNLLEYLSLETDYEAWYPMIRIFEDFSGCIPYPSTWIDGIKRFLLNILNGLLRNITFEVDPDEHEFRTCLRQEAIKWACFFNDSRCIEIVTARLNNSLIHSERNDRVPLPMWEEWMYCTGLQKGDGYMWDKLLGIYKSTRSPAILRAFPCIYVIYEDGKRFLNNSERSHTGSRNFLNDSEKLGRFTFENGNFTDFFAYLRNALSLTLNEELILFRSLVAKLGSNRYALQKIVNDLESIKPRKMTINAALCIIINHMYVSDKAETITQFSGFIERLFRKHTTTVSVGNISFSDLFDISIKQREFFQNLETSIIIKKINLRYSQMRKFIEGMTVFFETPNMVTDPYLKL